MRPHTNSRTGVIIRLKALMQGTVCRASSQVWRMYLATSSRALYSLLLIFAILVMNFLRRGEEDVTWYRRV